MEYIIMVGLAFFLAALLLTIFVIIGRIRIYYYSKTFKKIL